MLNRIERYHPVERPAATETEAKLENDREVQIAFYSTQDELQSQQAPKELAQEKGSTEAPNVRQRSSELEFEEQDTISEKTQSPKDKLDPRQAGGSVFYPFLGLELEFPPDVELPDTLRQRVNANWQPLSDDAKQLFSQLNAGANQQEQLEDDPNPNEEEKKEPEKEFVEPPQHQDQGQQQVDSKGQKFGSPQRKVSGKGRRKTKKATEEEEAAVLVKAQQELLKQQLEAAANEDESRESSRSSASNQSELIQCPKQITKVSVRQGLIMNFSSPFRIGNPRSCSRPGTASHGVRRLRLEPPEARMRQEDQSAVQLHPEVTARRAQLHLLHPRSEDLEGLGRADASVLPPTMRQHRCSRLGCRTREADERGYRRVH